MKKRSNPKLGARSLYIIYGALFLLLALRMLSIQITDEARGENLSTMTEEKYVRESTIQARRGSIVDREGEPIAEDTLSYKLFAVVNKEATPKNSEKKYHVTDPVATASFLAKHLELDEKPLRKMLEEAVAEGEKGNRWQVEFGKEGRGIGHEKKKEIQEEAEKLDITGLEFLEEKKRFYPNGIFASHLIGYSSIEEDEDGKLRTVGKMGIEQAFDNVLVGKNGSINYDSDSWGYILPSSEKMVTPAEHGSQIRLTIDQTIQNFIEDALTEVEEQYTPEKISVVIANPKTGEILGMGQRPTFNPETLEGLDESWLNEAIENTVEPGSTMKMFTLAAAIEEGKWRPNDTFMSGQYSLLDKTIRDANRVGWGRISYLEGFERSSNVGMAYLLESIGDKRFIEYIDEFGFGKKVGIELPNEAEGVVMDTYPSERLTTSYGQGTTVTPLQMIQAATAIANDGKMMQPYIIEEIYDPNEEEVLVQNEPNQVGTPISKETSEEVRKALASVVSAPHGTGRPFALTSYEVGGKTGTAEIPDPDTGYYMSGHGNYLYSFLGMAPIDDPQLVMYVSVQRPTLSAGEAGSTPVAKLFTTIMEKSLKHLTVVPKEVEEVETIAIDSYVGTSSSTASEQLREKQLQAIVIGEEGEVTEQYPAEKSELAFGSSVLLKTSGDVRIPDFTSWSKKMVLAYRSLSGLDIRIEGDGYVTEQSLSEGMSVSPSEPIVVRLQTPEQMFQFDPPVEEVVEESTGTGDDQELLEELEPLLEENVTN